MHFVKFIALAVPHQERKTNAVLGLVGPPTTNVYATQKQVAVDKLDCLHMFPLSPPSPLMTCA